MRAPLLLSFVMLCIAAASAPKEKPPTPDPVVILHQDVPLYDVYAWERWGNFINAETGSKTDIPYDAARLQVKVYTYPTGEIRAIRFHDGVRTHRHINQTDTVLYGWQAHRVQFVNGLAMVAGPGDFALHQKGVYHSGEEIRRGGGIDLEFAMPFAGHHNDPTGFWSLARDHAIEPAATWRRGDGYAEAIGAAAIATASTDAVRYRVRVAALPDYPAREVYIAKGVVVPSRDSGRDRLIFVAAGHIRLTEAGRRYDLGVEDTARAIAGNDISVEALDDALIVQVAVPARAPSGAGMK